MSETIANILKILAYLLVLVGLFFLLGAIFGRWAGDPLLSIACFLDGHVVHALKENPNHACNSTCP